MLADDLSPVAGTEVHYLDSEHVGDEFKIFVGHCGDVVSEPVAVLYVSDGNGLFAGAVEMIRFMRLSKHLPPMLVVGIGYRVGAIEETVAVRHRDFTPSYHDAYARIFPSFAALGGADNYLAFIRDELQPWVGARYNVDPARSAFFGHSLGGQFATYALLTEPTTFSRYGIGSPSLWWHNDRMFAYEAEYAETHDDLPARAFFPVGEHETHEGRRREASRLSAGEQAAAGSRYIDMVADTERMASALRGRGYPSLEVESVVLPDEFHATVAHLNLSRSLRFLFDAPH